MAGNPFRPSFGTTPPLLVGRDQAILAWGDALDGGPGGPGRATLYSGARGVGKTVMLNEAEAQAKERGWVVVSETATRGLVERLVGEGLPEAARRLQLPQVERRLSGLTLPMSMGGVDFDVENQQPAVQGLRSQLNDLTDHLADNGTGLLITVDELHAAARSEIQALGAVIQHCFREERPVAFAGAGLPAAVHDMLTADVLTFLRRADRHHLGTVATIDVEDALRGPVQDAGRSIDDDALAAAAAGTGGYPFLIQLVGYWVWRSKESAATIDLVQARDGLQAARRRMGTLVHEPALFDLSAMDRRFLAAMAADDGPSRMADVASRLGKDANYTSQYRLRLIAAEVIASAGNGHVDFTVPYLREYLRDNATALGL